MAKLSVVLPAYNEEAMLLKAAETLKEILEKEKIEYQLIFVDDGSRDQTWSLITEAARRDSHVTGIHFSRNFGKEAAIFAGLANAEGDCAAVMDCDLQHPPQTLVQMYRLWQEGYEVVEGVKRTRGKESAIHRASAGLFYKIMSSATKIDMSRASDFKLMDRRAVDSLLEMPERNAFFRAMSSWIGFRSTTVEFDVQEREAGESKWSTRSLIRYALTNIVGYSSAPMQMVTGAGAVVFLMAVVLGIQTLVKYFSGHAVEGFTTVILLLLFIGSVIMISLGIIGYYISRIYEEVKGRPRYIISRKIQGETLSGRTPEKAQEKS
ncbi:MAG TPA: glycosyltransferase [Candidatus Merdiplasma excrementigallinarum]|uniref:Glycosyltransferase n=1 Tax=Candidatus Merdiplasma excrementigallinarum TaxID=2840864 RepID=A0A9D1NXU3_9FIRM|nr:glycosyltransferase [Candidatus Merdiplasma excrementigallinarum]